MDGYKGHLSRINGVLDLAALELPEDDFHALLARIEAELLDRLCPEWEDDDHCRQPDEEELE